MREYARRRISQSVYVCGQVCCIRQRKAEKPAAGGFALPAIAVISRATSVVTAMSVIMAAMSAAITAFVPLCG